MLLLLPLCVLVTHRRRFWLLTQTTNLLRHALMNENVPWRLFDSMMDLSNVCILLLVDSFFPLTRRDALVCFRIICLVFSTLDSKSQLENNGICWYRNNVVWLYRRRRGGFFSLYFCEGLSLRNSVFKWKPLSKWLKNRVGSFSTDKKERERRAVEERRADTHTHYLFVISTVTKGIIRTGKPCVIYILGSCCCNALQPE